MVTYTVKIECHQAHISECRGTLDSIPATKMYTHHDYIVPGFNEFAKQLHSEARADYL